jgi:hypothetical protein
MLSLRSCWKKPDTSQDESEHRQFLFIIESKAAAAVVTGERSEKTADNLIRWEIAQQ